MNKLLVIQAASRPDISDYILNRYGDVLIQKAKEIQANLSAEELCIICAVGHHSPDGIQVIWAPYSPALENAHGVAAVLKGKLPRPQITEEIPQVEGKELAILTLEELFYTCYPDEGGFIEIRNQEEKLVIQSSFSRNLQDILEEHGINHYRALLLGGMTGRFMDASDVSSQLFEKDCDWNSVEIFKDTDCMVHEMAALAKEIQSASCGKCVLCREGSLQFESIIEDMTCGKARMTDIEMLREMGALMKAGSYCSFGQHFPNVFLSGFHLFSEEIEAHIRRKKCRNGVCEAFASYCILPKLCTGCEDCVDACPEEAITGKSGYIHMIDEDLCEKCGKCLAVCSEEAIIKVVGAKPKLPSRLTRVGKF